MIVQEALVENYAQKKPQPKSVEILLTNLVSQIFGLWKVSL